MASIPSIPEFFKGRSIFITGATGFMGKVLVEKLLRSCPQLKAIYLLIRPKRGKEVHDRLDELLAFKLFDKLIEANPNFKSKVFAVEGDIIKEGLGIGQVEEKLLMDEVSVVFHSASTIKFDESMKLSVEMNITGLKKLLELCKKMKKLEAFIHISTAFANCDREQVGEEIYPPPIHPNRLMSAVEWLDTESLDDLTPKMVGNRPNTYTYTKAVAEYLLKEEAGGLPVAIVRPSILGATYREPFKGWVDNFNGPSGLLASIGKGVLRSIKGDFHATADIIPVDFVSNMIIAAAWFTATHKPSDIKMYNCTTGQLNRFTWGQMERLCYEFMMKNPLNSVARIPNPKLTKSPYVRIQDKIQKAVRSLDYFTSHQWEFTNNNILMLQSQLSEEDKKEFFFDVKSIDWRMYMEWYCLGTKQYVLKEELSQLPNARKSLARLKKINFLMNVIIVIIVWRLLIHRSVIARTLWNSILDTALQVVKRIPSIAKSS
ncbi:hypothetical protein CHS0354_036132 [Potamilus streckersoni]|uniref:Fatty acyl-CoA reductase n=1 Tax=Potamilus streckersoni TaxID=2493646 RepID=A0AAE0T4N5_9BIVA|nr:hypothetical protein CHS0354_036132 [Potamilus streckersoni]